ncbi:MAG: hypothetical protein ACOCXH_00475 [Cyclobacteriaceae bacterium]
MWKKLNKLIISFALAIFALVYSGVAHAQCAMCRATVENNVSNGNVGIASNLNTGILYLFFAPYLVIGVVGYFWYKSSKKNASKISIQRNY